MAETLKMATAYGVPRRSCLSVPASSPRKLEKALAIDADELVLDLEDAVAPAMKGEARAAVVAALGTSAWAERTVAVRVNAPSTPWCHLDLVALAALAEQPLSIVLPKVESVGDLAFVDRLLAGAESRTRQTPLRVQALIETAAGLARASEIAAGSKRLETLIVGYADLAVSLGRRGQAPADRGSWGAAQHAILVAARARELQAIDGPYLGVEPDASFRTAATHARDLGFDGKWAIHPTQVPALNQLFTPSTEEIERARAMLAVLEGAERERREGAVSLDGEMIDEALAAGARRLLSRVEAEQ